VNSLLGAKEGADDDRFRRARVLAGVLFCLCSRPALAVPAFELVWREADGLTLETRAVGGTEQPELRVRVQVDATPLSVADVVWSQGPGADASRYLDRRDILSSGPGVRLEHHVVVIPLLGHREVILRFTRQDDARGGISIQYNSGGPGDGLPAGAPRMPLLRGTWRFTRVESGGMWIEFCSVSDPGGVPAILTIGPQRQLAVAQVRDAIRRSKEPRPVEEVVVKR